MVNDVGGVVQVALDAEMLERQPMNFHPLDNSMTTAVSTDGLLRFLEAEAHPARVVRFPGDSSGQDSSRPLAETA